MTVELQKRVSKSIGLKLYFIAVDMSRRRCPALHKLNTFRVLLPNFGRWKAALTKIAWILLWILGPGQQFWPENSPSLVRNYHAWEPRKEIRPFWHELKRAPRGGGVSCGPSVIRTWSRAQCDEHVTMLLSDCRDRIVVQWLLTLY